MEIKVLGAFLVGIGIAIFIGGYLFARTIRQYDENDSSLFKKYEDLKGTVDKLKGEHDTQMMHCPANRRRK